MLMAHTCNTCYWLLGRLRPGESQFQVSLDKKVQEKPKKRKYMWE
jgi:hypothetical protein